MMRGTPPILVICNTETVAVQTCSSPSAPSIFLEMISVLSRLVCLKFLMCARRNQMQTSICVRVSETAFCSRNFCPECCNRRSITVAAIFVRSLIIRTRANAGALNDTTFGQIRMQKLSQVREQ